MNLKSEKIYENAKYRLFHAFIQYHGGIVTDEELERELVTCYHDAIGELKGLREVPAEERTEIHKRLDTLFSSNATGTECVEALRKYFNENTNPLTIEAIEYYWWTRKQDREKAKELFLKAYEEGDYYAECFVKRKGWIN